MKAPATEETEEELTSRIERIAGDIASHTGAILKAQQSLSDLRSELMIAVLSLRQRQATREKEQLSKIDA